MSGGTTKQPRLVRWEHSTEWPLAALAVLFLGVYATEVLAVGLSQVWHLTLRVADYVIWALFVAEFFVRVALAHARHRYVLRHLPDLAMLALPFLRALRVLRLIPLLRALNRWVVDSLRGRVVVYGGTTAVLLVFCGALAELDAERRHAGAHITTFGTRCGGRAVTISTVGYGDYVPGHCRGPARRRRRDDQRRHARRRRHRVVRHLAHRTGAGRGGGRAGRRPGATCAPCTPS